MYVYNNSRFKTPLLAITVLFENWLIRCSKLDYNLIHNENLLQCSYVKNIVRKKFQQLPKISFAIFDKLALSSGGFKKIFLHLQAAKVQVKTYINTFANKPNSL